MQNRDAVCMAKALQDQRDSLARQMLLAHPAKMSALSAKFARVNEALIRMGVA